MRLENPPAGIPDKIIWKRSRYRSIEKTSRQRNSETWWRRTTAMLLVITETLLGVSFETYLRLWGDILMGIAITSSWDVVTAYQQEFVKTYLWDVLATFHWDIVGCFIWDVPATSLGRTNSRHDVLLPDGNKFKSVSSISVSHKFIFHESKANPKCINKNPIISTFFLFWNSINRINSKSKV